MSAKTSYNDFLNTMGNDYLSKLILTNCIINFTGKSVSDDIIDKLYKYYIDDFGCLTEYEFIEDILAYIDDNEISIEDFDMEKFMREEY